MSDIDGALADEAGEISVAVGRVIPVPPTKLGVTYDKLLYVDFF